MEHGTSERPKTPPRQILDDGFVQHNMIPGAPRKARSKRARLTDSEDEMDAPPIRRPRWS
ncbi:hypothetical protein FPOAC2_14507 [Fusarium poae]